MKLRPRCLGTAPRCLGTAPRARARGGGATAPAGWTDGTWIDAVGAGRCAAEQADLGTGSETNAARPPVSGQVVRRRGRLRAAGSSKERGVQAKVALHPLHGACFVRAAQAAGSPMGHGSIRQSKCSRTLKGLRGLRPLIRLPPASAQSTAKSPAASPRTSFTTWPMRTRPRNGGNSIEASTLPNGGEA